MQKSRIGWIGRKINLLAIVHPFNPENYIIQNALLKYRTTNPRDLEIKYQNIIICYQSKFKLVLNFSTSQNDNSVTMHHAMRPYSFYSGSFIPVSNVVHLTRE